MKIVADLRGSRKMEKSRDVAWLAILLCHEGFQSICIWFRGFRFHVTHFCSLDRHNIGLDLVEYKYILAPSGAAHPTWTGRESAGPPVPRMGLRKAQAIKTSHKL